MKGNGFLNVHNKEGKDKGKTVNVLINLFINTLMSGGFQEYVFLNLLFKLS